MNAIKRLMSALFAIIFRSRDAQSRDVHDKVQLWEGGPYWATTNIGAEKPSDSGFYFWWGDTIGYKRENDAWVASDGSSSNFAFGSAVTPTYKKNLDALQGEGWVTADGILAPEQDVAHVKWGGGWRLPTKEELSDLTKNCDWAWGTLNGMNGYTICGRGAYASSSIFLPAAGGGRRSSAEESGERGRYWSSSTKSSNTYGWHITFDQGRPLLSERDRFNGHTIRPVLG